VALNGVVTSQEEGQMEGVLVSAKKEGSRMTVTVVSDNLGRYAFPVDRLEPGNYRLKMRAIGYDLDDPGVVKIETGKTAQVNLRLQKTKDLASQMTNADWMLSVPDIKKRIFDDYKFGTGCNGCHSLSVVMKSKYRGSAWLPVLRRMWSYTEASLYEPGEVRIMRPSRNLAPLKPDSEKFAEFLSSINLSSPDGKWKFELKTLPRLKGRSTKVILTEWDLPRREAQPHDAAVDPDGMVWYTDHTNAYLGRLNPRTGEIKEWLSPTADPEHPDRQTTNTVRIDPEGNPWMGVSGGIAKFDKKTEKFTVWKGIGGGPIASDGMVWGRVNTGDGDDEPRSGEAVRLDPKTGEIRRWPYPKGQPLRFYGYEPDSRGNLYLASLQYSVIGVLNGKTGEWNLYPTPTPDAGSRRGTVDSQDRFWFAEYYVGQIGMFDPKTKQIKEWKIASEPLLGGIYAVTGVDKNGEVWGGGEFTEYIVRLNPVTGEVTNYPGSSSGYMQVQKIDVDPSTASVAVWYGQSHVARIARLEPLD
jgi:streptogramin lyase